jgi:MYXO-CTERM domain-containing protein
VVAMVKAVVCLLVVVFLAALAGAWLRRRRGL